LHGGSPGRTPSTVVSTATLPVISPGFKSSDLGPRPIVSGWDVSTSPWADVTYPFGCAPPREVDMKTLVRRGNVAKHEVAALALGIFERPALGGAAQAVDLATRGAISRRIRQKDFSGRFLETLVLYPAGLGAARLILVGLGSRDAFSSQRARQASA